MKKSNTFILLLSILLSISACRTSWNGMPKFVNPEFPGGVLGWNNYIKKNLEYPTRARKNNIVGRVMTSFVVNEQGKIVEVKVLNGIGGGCDEEAIRVLKNAPLWKPAYLKGKPVRTSYTMPISFILTE